MSAETSQVLLLAGCELNSTEIWGWWSSASWPEPDEQFREGFHSLSTQSGPSI